jgi:hypothetical protein
MAKLISYKLSIAEYRLSYMPEQVQTIVKIPLSEIADNQKEKHSLSAKFIDAIIEGENLVLSFAIEQGNIIEERPNSSVNNTKRRSRKRRNRMKTRGWPVIARITNSKGQKCSIYKPFVDALKNQNLTIAEQMHKVESILRANRNKPSDESVQYFLDNTLEYLRLLNEGKN